MYTFEERESFLMERGMSEDEIFHDNFAREWYYEVNEDGRKEKVYLEDVVRGCLSGEA